MKHEYNPISYEPRVSSYPEPCAVSKALGMLDTEDTALSLQDKLRSIVSPSRADDLVVKYRRERGRPTQNDKRRRVYLRVAIADIDEYRTKLQVLAGDI